jgi:lysophospholipase L1-like esterase
MRRHTFTHHHKFLAACAASVFVLTSCANPTDDAALAAAESRAANLASDSTASPNSSKAAPSTPPKMNTNPSATALPSASSAEEPEEATSVNLWADYPWGSNGQECPGGPGVSTGASTAPLDKRVVVILGDSLIRNAEPDISSRLEAEGFRPVFVCWGGKNLEWGAAQVDIMRSMGLLPRCLVINLGTNDLKGTTAQGLADAVDLRTVGDRLTYLLTTVADIDHVFTVDISAETSAAPTTMSSVSEAPAVWAEAVASTGIGRVIPWSQYSTPGSGLTNTDVGDGVHDTADGIQLRARLIADAVASTCG